MPTSEKVRDLSALVRAQAKRVKRESTMLVQLAARLDEAMSEDTNHSPEEDTDDRDSHTRSDTEA